ncbi:hypothetical protein [Streptomyces sp. 351MFTsu5.1]|uniref:hypothetical protein n=1 Tax=Streptomyces sp. 351MFTsu5.1 TaxID=1172180 RepID=UPI000375CC31|nr:hypothetical protein [Streptomyces sp. 351MFTsu5.1]
MSSDSPSAPESIPSPSSPARASYTFRLPLAEYSYSDADYEVIRAAEQVLARDCMKDFGLSYRPAKNPAPAGAQDRRYGLTDRASAERYGYRMPPQPDTPKVKLTEDQIKVLYGNRSAPAAASKNPELRYRGKKVPDSGCLGAAVLGFRKPYEDEAGAEVASRISTASYENSQKAPEVRAAFGKWSSCMKQQGYDYASPMEAMAAPEFLRGTVSAAEKNTAGADVSCKERTGLADVWFAAESSIQKDMIKADAGALRRLGELHEKKLRAARKILAGS